MKISVKKDGDGYLAVVLGTPHGLFTWGHTKEEALQELHGVLEVMMDISIEQLEEQRKLKNNLQKRLSHAV